MFKCLSHIILYWKIIRDTICIHARGSLIIEQWHKWILMMMAILYMFFVHSCQYVCFSCKFCRNYNDSTPLMFSCTIGYPAISKLQILFGLTTTQEFLILPYLCLDIAYYRNVLLVFYVSFYFYLFVVMTSH